MVDGETFKGWLRESSMGSWERTAQMWASTQGRRSARLARLVSALASMSENDLVSTSQRHLADKVGVTQETIRSYVADIVTAGLIEWEFVSKQPGRASILRLIGATGEYYDRKAWGRARITRTAGAVVAENAYRSGKGLPSSYALVKAAVQHGNLTLPAIMAKTGLAPSTIRKALRATRYDIPPEPQPMRYTGRDRKGDKQARISKEINRQREERQALLAWLSVQHGPWDTRYKRAVIELRKVIEPYWIWDLQLGDFVDLGATDAALRHRIMQAVHTWTLASFWRVETEHEKAMDMGTRRAQRYEKHRAESETWKKVHAHWCRQRQRGADHLDFEALAA